MSKRETTPVGAKTVGPAAGDRSLHHLGIGNDHRGVTWWDAAAQVVWLCAYGLHRSGEPDDAFHYFDQLLDSGSIYPTPADYEWLENDLTEGFALRLGSGRRAAAGRRPQAAR
jgi:hypothetical protein